MCRKNQDIDLSSLDFSQNPYSYYDILRKSGNIHYIEKNRTFLVLGYKEILEILLNHEIFSSEGVNSFDPILLNCDPPKHTLHRQILKGDSGLFSQSRISNLSSQIDVICKQLLCGIKHENFDVIQDFAQQYSSMVMLNLLGLKNIGDILREWTYSSVSSKFIHDNSYASESWKIVFPLIEQLMDEVYLNKQAEGIAEVLFHKDAPVYFTKENMLHLVKILLVGGNETTPNLIGSVLYFLLKNPEWIDRVKKDKLILSNVIHEILRLESPTQIVHRIAKQDIVIGGITIPANSLVGAAIGAGNRDPDFFESPNEFVLERKNKKILSFGYGAHHCLGDHLSKQETEIAIYNILEAFPQLRISPEFVPIYRFSSHVRGMINLPVKIISEDVSCIQSSMEKAVKTIEEDITTRAHFSTLEYYPEFKTKETENWHYTYPSPFIHSNVMYSLLQTGDETLAKLALRGKDFLEDTVEYDLLWRFWSVKDCQHPVPPDIDDTAMASFVLSKIGVNKKNKGLLCANINPQGSIRTWIKEGSYMLLHHPLMYWGVKKSRKALRETKALEMFSWDDHEPGVAANVLMYLGENECTKKAIQKCIEDWSIESGYMYYRKKITVAYHIARAFKEGVLSFCVLKDEIKVFIEKSIDGFDFAELLLAYLTLNYFGVESSLRNIVKQRIINQILSKNEEELFCKYSYFTSKDMVFFAGSPSLTAAWFLEVINCWEC